MYFGQSSYFDQSITHAYSLNAIANVPLDSMSHDSIYQKRGFVTLRRRVSLVCLHNSKMKDSGFSVKVSFYFLFLFIVFFSHLIIDHLH